MGYEPAANPSAIRLWRHLFGDRTDLLGLFTAFRNDKDQLSMPAERFYTPDQLDEAWAWARQQDSIHREVYFCAHQLLAPQRIKDNAAAVLALWCDVDDADLTRSPIRPTAVVQSSPGRFQAYARLTHAIPPLEAERFNKRWALSFGADRSGFDLTQLLRVPGTHNHKYAGVPAIEALEVAP